MKRTTILFLTFITLSLNARHKRYFWHKPQTLSRNVNRFTDLALHEQRMHAHNEHETFKNKAGGKPLSHAVQNQTAVAVERYLITVWLMQQRRFT